MKKRGWEGLCEMGGVVGMEKIVMVIGVMVLGMGWWGRI